MAFDVCGPLPQGTTLLEASAGTGKTYTIAALATRYVAEGRAELPEIMLVTFGRAATQELRERVRERLVSAERGLRDPAAARGGPDDLLRQLAAGTDAEVDVRRDRLAAALAGFDGATIATTHGFCQQMLVGLGLTGDTEPDVTFVENIADLVTEVVDDIYLRKFAVPGADAPLLSADCARTVARDAVADPLATLAPTDADPDTEAGQRHRLAYAVRHEVGARKRRQHLMDYDDLVLRLRDALRDPVSGPDACERVRSRYRIVLVDEFQDTDEAQWEVLRLAFHGSRTLVLIGDPKQAVYAFRGGDVTTYLSAAALATTRETLGCNWRSDAALLSALDRVYGGAALGDPGIVVHPVAAAAAGSRLAGAAPLRLRRLRREQCGPLDRSGMPAVARVRQRVADDLAADVVRLLTGDTRVAGEAVRPADVAVLVQTNVQGTLVRDSLAAAGVPVVLAGNTSVFATPAARDWLVLLQALEQPHRTLRARAVALTSFVGWSAQSLDEQGDGALDVLGPRLRWWAAVLAERGVAALFEVAGAGVPVGGVPGPPMTERLLAAPDGERRLTDLRHVAQSLHAVAVRESLGLTALLEWLERRSTEGVDGAAERSRRLESDAEAVQVVTVHRSKGLEFPVVYVPYAWDRTGFDQPPTLRLHDEAGTRVLDVGGPAGPGYAQRLARHNVEDAGEELRLLYVAMTRAKCQVVTWWAPSRKTASSALHRLLLGERDATGAPPLSARVPADARAAEQLDALAVPGLLAVEPIATGGVPARWQPARPDARPASARRFPRGLDTTWRRTSYSALTSAAHEQPAAATTEPEQPELPDEPPAGPAAAEPLPTSAGVGDPVPMADLPGGTAFGSLVHGVFEHVDPTSADLLGEITSHCTTAVAERPLVSQVPAVAGRPAPGPPRPLAPAELAAALLPVYRTPLGPLAAGRRLCDIPARDRLAELDFELPLAGGDLPGRPDGPAEVTVADLAPVLRRHLPTGDPLAGYPDLLAALEPQALRGYLAGSIDALLRVDGTYLVVDYKTNRLAAGGLTAWHYRPAAMAEAMLHAHYPLQALLYCVAAHRFLRGRLPSYDVERHLGGVLYLFVRGMAGPATPLVDGTPCGVFGWRPPAALVVELSELLAGRR